MAKRNQKKSQPKTNPKLQTTKSKVIFVIIVLACMLIGVMAGYLGDYYHAKNRKTARTSTKTVKVVKTNSGYTFDGPGKQNALIFYPGAKVEDLAYAKLLKAIAAGGVDCYLVHMPGNLAIFGVNKADSIIKSTHYNHYYLGGHSLGGAMVANYAAKNADKLDGLIFLAAYSTKDLSKTHLKVLSLYGTQDKVVNRDKIKSGRKLMPKQYTEIQIKGGNHAGFGDYGAQQGDGKATISGDKQKQITAQRILTLIQK